MTSDDDATLGSGAGEPKSDGDEDLRDALVALANLSTGHLGLEELLTKVATYAVRAIPGADGAGLTLLEHGRSATIVSTAPFVTEIDDIQYGLGQGPCISAAAEGQTKLSGSLGADQRWPQFGSKVARLGVHSVVSLPLITPGAVVGAMNVYAHAKHVFDNRAVELGELFAAPAAIAVENAQVLVQAQRLAAQLQAALGTRGVVDRAIGIMMSRTGATPDEALNKLRSLSQTEHVKLPVMAQRIVDAAVRRARALHKEEE
ncbi:GAF and ANTAR domain-containing protein [Microlunatus panaciterrae]|uniref:GAF domain-containing protein n=1 Tax=Microlunatus panaciterrae TaxID=400768 RepID=A0ABS2RK55_9ACTN|nr:GAF and ANTAR domain-containing protein [Microlunatus panaciterrae]MBM7799391.1 GAF domain-containing protein [Microlunatus panaciterrae]